MSRGRSQLLQRRVAVWAIGFLVLCAALAAAILSLPQAPTLSQLRPEAIPESPSSTLNSLTFSSPTTAWAVVRARPYWRLLRSTDSGAEWVDVTPVGAATNGGLDLTVLSSTEAVVAYQAYGYLRNSEFAVTRDGGARWSASILPGAIGTGPDPITTSATGGTWAVLTGGRLVNSGIRSATWTAVTLPLPPHGSCTPTSVGFLSPTSGWVSGTCAGVAALWETQDGGAAWKVVALAGSYRASTVRVSLPRAGASGSIFTTITDTSRRTVSVEELAAGAGVWSSTQRLATPPGTLLLTFPTSSRGWVVCLPSAKGALALAYQTVDGGRSWSLRSLPFSASQVTAVSLSADGRAFLLGQRKKQRVFWTSAGSASSWSESPLRVFSGTPPTVNGVRGG